MLLSFNLSFVMAFKMKEVSYKLEVYAEVNSGGMFIGSYINKMLSRSIKVMDLE